MKQKLRIIMRFFNNSWQRAMAYQLGALVWIINGFISPLILMNVWLLIREHQQLSMGNGEIITYYLLVILIIRLTQSWTAEDLVRDIKQGDFSKALLRPLHFSLEFFGKDMALRLVRLVSLLPFMTLALYIFRSSLYVSYQWHLWLLALLAIICGYLLNFLMQLSIGLTALWFEEGYGVFLLTGLISELLSGSLIPLALLPAIWRNVAFWLPFRFMISFPIELLMGQTNLNEMAWGFIILFGWIVIFWVLFVRIFMAGIKKYSSIGR